MKLPLLFKRRLALLSVLFIYFSLSSLAQNINTIAGIGTSSFSGDGGLAISAELAQPVSVVKDGSGNIYISDQGNHRIRKISASTGNISTIAGTTTSGYSGDGGAATSAKLYYPYGIAVDASGNIYIADQANNRIRKVTASTGIITTIAGNGTAGFSGDGAAATSAQLNNPAAIAVDGSGNIFIADQYNQRIRKITASTGNISTIAGTGTYSYSGDGGAATSATFQNPTGIELDASGNIYIADLFNHVIRKITASTGFISTVAGSGTAGYSGDGGAATSANLNYPTDIALDDSGNLYISVQYSHRIRKVSALTGNISTVAGTGTAAYGGDGGPATSAQINFPTGVSADAGGNLYIADRENHRIRFVCNYITKPTVTSPVTYCLGATATALTATGTSLKWYTSPTGGTGSTTAPTPSTATTGTVKYYVASVSPYGCEGPRDSIAVVVNSLPAAPTVTSPITYCLGATASPLTATGTSLKWYTSATGGTASTTAPTPSTAATGTTTYYVSQTSSTTTCESPRASIAVVITTVPAAPTATTSVTYCEGATAAPLSASGSGLLWYTTATGGTGSSTAPTPSTAASGTTTYYVSQSNSCGESSRTAITVTVNAKPSAPGVTSPVNYCQFATASILTASGTSLKWYTSATGGTGSTTAPTPSTATSGTTVYYVSQTSSTTACESDRASISVVVTAAPSAPTVTTPVNYCLGASASALTASGTSLKWYTVATGGTASTTAPTPSTASAGSTTYYVSQTSSTTGCESARSSILVVVNTIPAAPAVVTPVNYCQGVTATALTATGTSLLWYTSASGGTGSTTAPNPSTASTGTTTYYVSQSNSCGESSRSSIVVNVNPVPSPPTVVSPLTYCQGDSGVAALSAIGTSLKWYTSATGGTGSSTAPTPSTTTAGTTTYYVSQTNSYGCESSRAAIVVIIKPAPAAPIVTSPINYCLGATASALTATGTGLLWYTTPYGGVGSTTAPTPSTSTVGSITYYVSQTDTSSCPSLRAAITVNVHTVPAIPTVTSPVNYCVGATTSALTAGFAAGDTLKWYTSASGGTASLTAPTPGSAAAGTTTYYVSATSRYGCGESGRASISVVVNSVPGLPTVLSPVSYCQGATSSALSASGTSLKWYTSKTGGTASTVTPIPNTSVSGTYKFYVSQTVSGCESERDSITVTINATPAAPTVTTPVSYCVGAAASALTAGGTSLKWYTGSTGGTGSTTAPVPSTSSTGSITYYVSQTSASGCESSRAGITVNVSSGTVAPTVTSPVTYCVGATATALSATGTSLLWYTSATGGTGSSTAPTPSTTIARTDTFYVSQTLSSGGCGESPRTPIVVVVNPTLSAPTVPYTAMTYCSGKTATVLSATGINLKWYTVASGGTGSTTAPTPSTASAGTTVYYVSQTTALGCESPRSSISITVNTTPAAPSVTSPVEYCSGTTPTALTATGSSLKWYSTDTGSTFSTTAPTPGTGSTGFTYYYVSQTSALGCESPRAEINVIVYATPSAPTVGFLVTLCLGGPSGPLTATGSGLKWYTTATGGTGSTTAPTPSTASTGSTFYYVSQTSSSGCESPRATIWVNIDTLLSPPVVTTPVTYCQNETAIALIASGSSLRWYTGSPTGSYSTTSPVPLTTSAGTTKYYVSRVSVAGCEGHKDSITVTVNPLPAAPGVSSPVNYCAGATASALSATGTSLKWYTTSTGGTPSTTAPTPLTSTVGTTTYYVSQTSALGCEGPRASITVNINPTPSAPTVVSPVTYCAGATASPLTASGSGLFWYTSATGGTPSSTAPTPVTTTVGTTNYYVTQSSSLGCESPRAVIAVTINDLPTAPTVTTPVSYCAGATASPLSASGTSLKWYTIATGGSASTTAPTPGTSTAGTTTYYVSQTSALGCEGPRAAIVVTINALPAAPSVSSPEVYCEGSSTVPLSATGTSLKWYTAATGGTGSSTAPTPSAATAGTTTYYVSQTNSLGCEGPRAAIVVNINPLPGLPTVSSPVTYCQDASAVALTAAGTSLKWYPTATGSTGLFTTTAPTPSTAIAGSKTYYVSQTTAAGCEGGRIGITVITNPLPAAPFTETIAYCQYVTASPLTAIGTSLKWYTAATGGTGSTTAPTPSTATPGTTTYYVSQTSSDGCEGPRAALNVIINLGSTKPTVVSPVGYCVGAVATPLSAIGTSLKWYTSATGGIGSSTAPTPSTSTAGTTTYYVSQVSLIDCESPRASITVNVSAKPDVAIAPVGTSRFMYCKNDTVVLKGTSSTPISAYQWYKDDTLIAGATADTLKTYATGKYKLSIKNSLGCDNDTTVYVYGDTISPPILSPIELLFCPNVNIVLFCVPGTTDYKYEWFKDSTLMVGDTNSKIIINKPGEYYVRITDSLGCISFTNRSLASTYPPVPKPIIIRADPILRLSRSYVTYQWYRNSKVIPGANSISYTMPSYGGKFWCIVTDVNDCSEVSDTVDSDKNPTRINNASLSGKSIKIYPNPTQSKVFIESDFEVDVRVTDALGRLIIEQKDAKSIDMEPFADATYLFTITDKEGLIIGQEKISKITGSR